MAKDILNVGGFTIIKRIGNGARSTIYLATNEADGTSVALKRIVFERPEDSRVFEQTQTEYKVARRIDHPYVRKCYELKKIRSMFKVKEMLLSMELFDGKTLEDSPTLSLVDVLLVFRMVASGLNAIHREGFVHCDIKPNNILLSKSGSIKIIDFGQSCKIGTTKPRIQGTPDYIAPEKDSLSLVIPRSCPAPHELRKKVPVGVSKLVMDCVKDNPAERPRNMMTVVSKLDLMIHSILGDKIKTSKNASSNN